jgi:hypothetical protein
VPFEVRGPNDLEGVISKIGTDSFQAMVVTHDGLFYVQRKRLADLALEKRLPTIAFCQRAVGSRRACNLWTERA